MTCKEKLAIEYPHCVDPKWEAGCAGCPTIYGYLDYPDWCNGGNDYHTADDCKRCWDREIPENRCVLPKKDITDAGFDQSGYAPVIKDSGDRTQFESGAVRDMRAGKGRCDLMPLEAVSRYIEYVGGDVEGVIYNIAEFKRSGYSDTDYLYTALSAFCEDVYNCNYPTMFLEVAKHFEDGATKYGENNWQKGIPAKCYIDSAIRHYFKVLRDDKDEPHERAFVWNLMCCIWEVDYREKKEIKE